MSETKDKQDKPQTPSFEEIKNWIDLYNHKASTITITCNEMNELFARVVQGLVLNINERDEKIKELQVPIKEKVVEKKPKEKVEKAEKA